MELRDLAEMTAKKKLMDDKGITALCETGLKTNSSEWSKSIGSNKNTPPPPSVVSSSQTVTLSQIETALEAKWKSLPPPLNIIEVNFSVESAQRIHEHLRSELTSSMNIIKNETLYNISLESPLLRDADLLSTQSIAQTWRGN